MKNGRLGDADFQIGILNATSSLLLQRVPARLLPFDQVVERQWRKHEDLEAPRALPVREQRVKRCIVAADGSASPELEDEDLPGLLQPAGHGRDCPAEIPAA